MAETSTKPYLIRAIYEWCNDNGYTPYLAVAVDERTQVPREHVKAGEIVLNVSPMATNRLALGNDLISFQARFGGVARELSIPVENVSAIYARENGQGMAFPVAAPPAGEAAGADARVSPLSRVPAAGGAEGEAPVMQLVPGDGAEKGDKEEGGEPPRPPGGGAPRPALKRIK